MKKIFKFFADVREELKKVSWPTKEEVLSSSAVVIVFILILSLILGFVDFLASTIIGLILR
ncbi:MAG: preprotein translocase subunit SecE [Brevinematia bacterium]|jgi:preprotein translocase subunit SecE